MVYRSNGSAARLCSYPWCSGECCRV